jgi:acetyl esterase/lipase
MKRIVLPAIFLALISSTALCDTPATQAKLPPIPQGAKLLRDVPYVTGPNAHERQKLDIITIPSAKPAPLIVWVHGGGWIAGSKNILRVVNFTRDGYAVAAINYRLSLHAPFPAQIEDCKSAIRFLRAHAREYNIDPERIGVWGESAGGHLVALLGTSGGNVTLAGDKPQNSEQSDRVQCVVDYFGPTDLLQIPAMAGPDVKYDFNGPNSLLTRLLGGPMTTKRKLATIANPITHISKDDPPFLIVHGTADPIVPIGQSKILVEALKKAGIQAEMISVTGAGHGLGIYGDAAVSNKVKAFFAGHLKPEASKAAGQK